MNIKLGVFLLKNWKLVCAIILGLILLIVQIPVIMFSLIFPSADYEMVNTQYKVVARQAGLDWSELITYDTVRYDNDFSSALPLETAYEFLSIDVKTYKKVKIKVIDDNIENTSPLYYEMVVDKVKNYSGYKKIKAFLYGLAYTDIQSIPGLFDFIKNLDKTDKYDISISRFSIDDLIDNFDHNKQLWAYEVLSSVNQLYGDSNTNQDFYLPDGNYSFISPTPTCNVITSSFGYRTHPVTGKRSFHHGIDLSKHGGSYGEPVVAIADGIITEVNFRNGVAGLFVRISHTVDGSEWQSRYCHLSAINVVVGEKVIQGQLIGAVGDTGRVTGPHLHFELKYKGGLLNPTIFL